MNAANAHPLQRVGFGTPPLTIRRSVTYTLHERIMAAPELARGAGDPSWELSDP